jgi:Phage integrase family
VEVGITGSGVPDRGRRAASRRDGPDGWVLVNDHGQSWHHGNFNRAVHWRDAREQIGLPNLHLHDPRHTGNTLAAQSGASLRDLMTRMGHDSPAAALIYQHSSRVADEAIAAALDARLTERKSRPAPNVVVPVEGPNEPQLIAVEPGRSGKRASDQG